MRSLSEVLIKKREEKNLSIDQVSYETNISREYLRALEAEDFSVFPAEAYLLGFLRNYSEFLGLDFDKIYSEYKNCLIREEPVPLDALVGKRAPIEFRLWMIVVPVVIALLAILIPPSIKGVSGYIEKRKEALRIAALEAQIKDIEITDELTGHVVTVGDTFSMMIGDDKLTYSVKDITRDILLQETLSGKIREVTLILGEEVEYIYSDSNNTSYYVSLVLNDVGVLSDKSAEVKIKKSVLSDDVEIIKTDLLEGDETLGNARVLMNLRRATMPYAMNIIFEGDILFRYQELGKEMVESLYRSGSSITIEVTRSIQVWTSNAGLTKIKINNDNLVIGKTGAVSVFALKWIYYKDRDEYRLEYHETF